MCQWWLSRVSRPGKGVRHPAGIPPADPKQYKVGVFRGHPRRSPSNPFLKPQPQLRTEGCIEVLHNQAKVIKPKNVVFITIHFETPTLFLYLVTYFETNLNGSKSVG